MNAATIQLLMLGFKEIFTNWGAFKDNLKRPSTLVSYVTGAVAVANPELLPAAVINPDTTQLILAVVTIIMFIVRKKGA